VATLKEQKNSSRGKVKKFVRVKAVTRNAGKKEVEKKKRVKRSFGAALVTLAPVSGKHNGSTKNGHIQAPFFGQGRVPVSTEEGYSLLTGARGGPSPRLP